MSTTWKILIDWERSGTFTNLHDDVTAYTLSAEWFLGFAHSYQDTADNSQLTLMLDNSDQRFSPEFAASVLNGDLNPLRPVQIRSLQLVGKILQERIHWTGWIETIEPSVGAYGKREVKLTATGPMPFFKAAKTDIELQINQRTDLIIDKLLQQVPLPQSLLNVWHLDVEVSSNLGQGTRLIDPTVTRQLQPGQTSLELAADNWINRANDKEAKFNVYRAIADVVGAERGRFFFARDGKAIFWNRTHTQDEHPSLFTLNDNMTNMTYRYASSEADFKNEIIVTCHPREIGEISNETLWRLRKPIEIPPNKQISIKVTYRDKEGSEARIGAMEAILTGVEFSEGMAFVQFKPKATDATIEIYNISGIKAILKSATVQGRKIRDYGEIVVEACNYLSIANYGRRTLHLSLKSVENREYAQMVADYELARRDQPRGIVSQVTLKSHWKQGGLYHTEQLRRTIGNVITLTESQTAHHNKRYYIIGEFHYLNASSGSYETTWVLEPAPNQDYPFKLGVIGRAELGGTLTGNARLAF